MTRFLSREKKPTIENEKKEKNKHLEILSFSIIPKNFSNIYPVMNWATKMIIIIDERDFAITRISVENERHLMIRNSTKTIRFLARNVNGRP